MIGATALRLGRMKGWRRLAVAFIAGAATVFAFPPFSLIPVLWLIFPPLMWLLDGCRTRKSAIATGWAFGFGFFATGFFWITNAFFVDAETFGAIAFPAVISLSFALGLFTVVVTALTHIIPPSSEDDMPYDRVAVTALRAVLFAAVWTLMEWLRSWIFTGFPWNPMGAVWAETYTPIGGAVIQVTPLIGTYGLSLLTVLLAAMPAVLGYTPRLRRAWLTAAAPVAGFIVIGIGGAVRLAMHETVYVPGVKFRLVQANIPQTERARPSQWGAQLEDYVRLSVTDRPADITHVVWGEAAVPPTYFLNLDERYRAAVATAAPPGGMLITGADRGIRGENAWAAIYNSMYVITPTGEIAAHYDKSHLVPFGEYMPMRWLIPYEKITGGVGDFAAGLGLTSLVVPGLPPFTPLICYEAIFSGNVTPPRDVLKKDGLPRPQWLLNLTNDAWFGMSTGPYQHYATARLRAVEEGLPLVRTANTGISAVIDGFGRTVGELGLGKRGVVDAPLPRPAAAYTPFGFMGNLIPVLLATIAVAGALLFWRRRDRRR
jgi:apolipoprotein N-acyltransferase